MPSVKEAAPPAKSEVELISEKTIRKGNKVDIATFAISRDQQGICIAIRSAKLEEFFLSNAKGSSAKTLPSAGWDKFKYHALSSPDSDALSFSTPEADAEFNLRNDYLVSGNKVNLSFIRAVGLKDGIELKIPGVYSREVMGKLSKALKTAIQRIYVNFIKPYHFSCDLESHEYYHVDTLTQ